MPKNRFRVKKATKELTLNKEALILAVTDLAEVNL